MAKNKKTLEQCKTPQDFISYGEHRGGHIDRQCGSHAIMKAPSGGTCPVPIHNGDIPTGTRHSIIKRFILIGLGILIILLLAGII